MKPSLRSDFQSLLLINSPNQNSNLNLMDIYKGCAAVAVTGLELREEKYLNTSMRLLLETRRALHLGNITLARHYLNDSASSFLIENQSNSPLSLTTDSLFETARGDHMVLQATVLHRLGDTNAAAKNMAQAAEIFDRNNDVHRSLRARINEKLSLASDLSSYNRGELYALQLFSAKSGWHDLVGNISRSRAGQFLCEGFFKEAVLEARQAVKHYRLEGYPDDLATAYCILAIAYVLIGELKKANDAFHRVIIKTGKVASYVLIYESLISGKIPKVIKGHPLELVPWGQNRAKKESLSEKIILALKEKPKSRDELIAEIYGDDAIDPSYCNRLYSAITQIRKSGGHTILFNGSRYQLG